MSNGSPITQKILESIIQYQDGVITVDEFVREWEQEIWPLIERKLVENVVRNYGFMELPIVLKNALHNNQYYKTLLREECRRVFGKELGLDKCEDLLSNSVTRRKRLVTIYWVFEQLYIAVQKRSPAEIIISADAVIHTTHTLGSDDYNVLGENVESVKKILDKKYSSME